MDDLNTRQARARTALEKAQTRFDQARARLRAARARISTEDRKKDTRRKIVIGAILLDEAARSPQAKALVDRLITAIDRPHDKALFAGWQPGTPSQAGLDQAPAAQGSALTPGEANHGR